MDLGVRRLAILHALASATRHSRSPEAACADAARVLAGSHADLLFVLIYLVDEGVRARRAAAVGLSAAIEPSPLALDLADGDGVWPIARVARSLSAARVDLCDALPCRLDASEGAVASEALALPILQPGDPHAAGVLVAAVSPERPPDDSDHDFLALVAGQIGAAIAGARALQEADARAATLAALETANRELSRRVAELHTLLDVLPVGIGIAADRECRDIRVNRAFAATLGLDPDANASKTAPAAERPLNFRVVTPDGCDVADEDLPMQRAARDGIGVADVELDIVHGDGRVNRLLEYAAPLFDERGELRGAVGAFVDVTGRHQAEQALRQEVEIRSTLARVGASLAGELDPDRLVQAVTDAGTKLTNAEFGAFFYNATDEGGHAYSLYALSGAPEEAFAQFPHPHATEVFGPTFRGEFIIRLDDVTADPRYGRNPPFHDRPEGHLPVRSYLAVPVVARGGEVLGGLFFGHSRAGMFREHHEQLAAGVASWAAIALDNARLYRDVERANRLKDEFLATLSHELRTPLNAVLGWAHMLRIGAVTPVVRERALESLERNAKAQAQLVEDLLDVSRIMSGKLQIRADPVDLGAVIANAVDTVRPGAAAKGVRLQANLDTGRRIVVTGDTDRLQQIVWNLLSNAVKFTPADGRVDVELRQAGAKAEIVVRDTGQGISAAFRTHLFERFRQSDSSTARKHGGLGLGLSIVRHLTEAHGGTVAGDSPGEGQGSTFVVRLPVRAVQPPAPHAAGADAVVRSLDGIRALVVDDESDAQELIRFVLADRGADVAIAASAGEALHLFAGRPFDVLIADIGMPEQDGYALVRALRGLPAAEGGAVPAIAVTAYASLRERERALAAGYDRHLAKPVDPEELVAAVAALAAREEPRA